MKELPLNQILCGDCEKLLPGFPENSIDLAVTSSPYWGLREYGIGENQLGLEPHPQMFIDHLVEICREIKRVLKPWGSFWLNLGDSYYSNPSNQQGSQVSARGSNREPRRNNRNLRSNWLQPKQLLGIPWRVAIALQEDGWILRNSVIWYKPNHMPESSKDRLTSSYEFVFFMVRKDAQSDYHIVGNQPNKEKYPIKHRTWLRLKEWWGDKGGVKLREEIPYELLGATINLQYYFDLDAIRKPHQTIASEMKRKAWKVPVDYNEKESMRVQRTGRTREELFNLKGKNPGDIWEINTQPFPGAHFAVFPSDLIEPIIKAGSPKNGVVLDPFAGSGTALRVARKLGRRFIGIEINPEYAEMCERRVRADKYQEPPEDVLTLTEAFEDVRKEGEQKDV